ncbi:glyoxalase/bleomycin resistance/dioxygenase family protein [Bacillus pseudomycoides]|uniref:Glyoxalase/bleomycin resistance/dioxygenase family protein n=1 Tax=Bacillus pseudomycoides TaxID=64104 RepID=A0AA91VFJ3_9BACI|nr:MULTISPECIES: glyoxalase/bleomycin resistance/dioxygenase family protein [Bacillus]PEB52241.1 glyoxalase/bleomycin resistance/dioxygenase family protein [Bacillus sp. AFS098217]PED84081.1 glyoxalase/bleomycin resistance/dioxygenase family protein [Bacillus pseudomycoides]PEU11659.1 glyoxalase/bleomycin resistance/dioxygenase family protein [Bacillus sp. AFS019443]PEU12837.1 glyoxalase/bleomycin resistance/dioxygenase family protein [Bacillus sp. AFS014408]PFW64732.1 glyoxalase/bleomycin res
MITHISDIKLQTLSIEGVKQVYRDILSLPIKKETASFVQFQITPYTTISFHEIYEPIVPTHFAFQVPFSKFFETAKWVEESGLLIAKWKDGHTIDEENGCLNLYFRDGDGNLLEIIAHNYVEEDVLIPHSPLNVLYIREIGLPVKSVPAFTKWLKSNLRMNTIKDGEIFNFVISGTAYIVANSWNRPWLPIAMKALPPKIHVSFGTPNLSFLQEIQEDFRQNNVPFDFYNNEVSFIQEGYSFSVQYTTEFHSDIPSKLKLPLSIKK